MHTIYRALYDLNGARGIVVSKALCYKRVLDQLRSMNFLNHLILPAALDPGVAQPLTEMSTRSRKIMFPGSNPVPGGITGPPCSWGYKYEDLALQVGGVSDETVKYGHGSCATRTTE
jgi:hypothetical protein